jgi:hypothetical protein
MNAQHNMQAYLVRFRVSKELVGIYVCSTRRDLFALVDELLDPFECEFAAIGEGGFHWTGEAQEICMPWHTKTVENILSFEGCEPTESWGDKLWGHDKVIWNKFKDRDNWKHKPVDKSSLKKVM